MFVGEGGAYPALPWGGGYPCLRVTSQWQAPPKVPKVALPSRFPARFHVGDSIQFVAQNCDRVGVPLGFHERVTLPPLSFNVRGIPIWGG